MAIEQAEQLARMEARFHAALALDNLFNNFVHALRCLQPDYSSGTFAEAWNSFKLAHWEPGVFQNDTVDASARLDRESLP